MCQKLRGGNEEDLKLVLHCTVVDDNGGGGGGEATGYGALTTCHT